MAITPLTVTIDLNPSYKKIPAVYVSQLDNNLRSLAITVKDGGVNYDVASSGYDVYVEGTKPDKHGFSYKVTDIGGTVVGSVVTVPMQTQMTCVQGMVPTEIVLKSGSDRIGSANFLLVVERAGLAEDVDVSETDIPAYIDGAQQAAAAAAQSADDAEDAKDLAVAAKDTAVSVAASIPEDYTTLSNDVDDLKSAFDNDLIMPSAGHTIIQGSYNSSGAVVANPARIRVSGFIEVKQGETIKFTAGTNTTGMLVGIFNASKVYQSESWYGDGASVDIVSDGFVIIVYRKDTSNTAITPAEYDAVTQIVPIIWNDLNSVTSAINHISVEQLKLDYYPLDLLPQVSVYKNKRCNGFDTSAFVPGDFVDYDGQDIYEFNVAELIADGVTKVIVYDQLDVAGQKCILWTEGVSATDPSPSVIDGCITYDFSNSWAQGKTWMLLTFTHGNAWMKFAKNYSDDTIERNVTGWLRASDMGDGEIEKVVQESEVLSTQIETELRTYTTTADTLGDVIDKGQIIGGTGTTITYTVSSNANLCLSILPLSFLHTIEFDLNPVSYQWGIIIAITDDTDYCYRGLNRANVVDNTTDYSTYNDTTGKVIVDCERIREIYPDATKIYISSRKLSEFGAPIVTTTNQRTLADFKWLVYESDAAELLLPQKVPAVVGLPSFCYFETLLPRGWLKDFNVTDTTYLNFKDARKYTPSSEGTSTVKIRVLDKNTLKTTGNLVTTAVARAASSVTSVKVLCIGDSKTEAKGKRVRVNELVADDSTLNVTFIGTRGTAPTLSEGYSGKSIIDLCRSANMATGVANIFYDSSMSGDNKFNFAQGVATIGEAPDIVFIDHGSNQIYQPWATVLSCYEDVIDSIQSYDSNIKIVICVQECGGFALTPSQYVRGNKNAYGWGNPSNDNYSIGKMLTAFEGRESENVFVCPQYICVDPYNDYPLAMLPLNEDNQMKTLLCLDTTHPGTNTGVWQSGTSYAVYSYVRKNDKAYAAVQASQGIDPETDDGTYWSPIVNQEAGYNKIGDMYYAMIKYILSL